MIETVPASAEIRRTYDLWSTFYGWFSLAVKRGIFRRAFERAAIRPGERVLEVAVGPGVGFREILKRVGRDDIVHGVDFSSQMLAKTEQRARRAGFANFRLQQADARRLPFADGAFDVVFNSYMFDLLPIPDMSQVLGEFHRVLKPGGRLVLVNLSKRDEGDLMLWERLYRSLSPRWAARILGGCRPVLTARLVQATGFVDVDREFIPHLMATELVSARKP
jgi:demethylmenaquinone methyltransferase/2-methoxy-6-polyprenyl-1,4-benzoquinol methylase